MSGGAGRTDQEAALVARLRAAGCVYAEEEAAVLLDTAMGSSLEPLVRRRIAGEPLEYVVGWAEVAGRRVGVRPGVFVPRRRTGLLVRTAEDAVREADVAVELCCGAAPVALAWSEAPGLEVHAADIDAAAVACAGANLAGTSAAVHQGDLFAALPQRLRGRIDVLAVNAPYVPSAAVATMPAEAREHEPRHTLDGGPDGLEVHRRVAAEARAWLAPGGVLLVELAPAQLPAAATMATAAGLEWLEPVRDEDLDATVARARRTG